MTWDDLKRYFTVYQRKTVKVYPDEIMIDLEGIYITFKKNGSFELKDNYSGLESVVVETRTPDQMYQIITALTETKE